MSVVFTLMSLVLIDCKRLPTKRYSLPVPLANTSVSRSVWKLALAYFQLRFGQRLELGVSPGKGGASRVRLKLTAPLPVFTVYSDEGKAGSGLLRGRLLPSRFWFETAHSV